MSAAVRQVGLVPIDEPPAEALAKPEPEMTMVERMARDPNVDVDKLQKLIDMQERFRRQEAIAAFDEAFAKMQGKLPIVTERGEIAVNGVVRSKYARYEDIIEAVRPILQEHGFSLRHRNEVSTDGERMKIVGILSHSGGHREEDVFECAPDNSGGKQTIQARGSSRSYGQRYTTISLLNIVTRGADDDGKTAHEKQPETPAPQGYADWCVDLASAADEGTTALMAAWNDSKLAFRKHLTATDKGAWEALKARAAKVKTNG